MPEYAVREPAGSRQLARGARRAAPLLAIAVGLALAAAVLPDDLPVRGVAAGMAVLAALRLGVDLRPAMVLRVGPTGVQLDEQHLPWRSVGRITIMRYPPSGTHPEVEVAAALRAEPGTEAPAGPPLRAITRGDRMDVERLVQSIRAHALPDTEIVEDTADATGAREGAGDARDTRPAEAYVLTQTSSLRGVLRRVLHMAVRWLAAIVLLVALAAVWASGMVEPVWGPLLRTAAVLTAIALLVILAWTAWPKTVLRVGPSGLEFAARSIPALAQEVKADRVPWPSPHADFVTIPWSSIWQVAVIYPEPGSPGGEPERPIQIGLRPRRNAPLPGHVAVRISEPSDPSAIPPRLRISVQHTSVHIQALVEAVRAHARDDIIVMAVRGKAEYTLG